MPKGHTHNGQKNSRNSKGDKKKMPRRSEDIKRNRKDKAHRAYRLIRTIRDALEGRAKETGMGYSTTHHSRIKKAPFKAFQPKK